MNVPLLDLKPQLAQLRPQIMEAVTRVVDSTGYILGREVNELEEKIAAYCGAAHGIGVSSGTDALPVSLMSLDIGPGDLVLTTPSRERTGQSLLVEDVLAEVGITDLSRYAAVPGTPDEALFPDVFL